MSKKILYWALYDFANSVVLIAFLFYFSQWLVVDQGKPVWWYNGSLIVSSVLFIASAPFASRKIDSSKKKIQGLRFWTTLSIAGFLLTAYYALFTEGKELAATVAYSLTTYVYLMCFLYFTPMLSDISIPTNRSWVSGIGQAANSIGQVVGILAVLPFVNGITLFGEPGRAQALFPAIVLFVLLSLPLLILYREEIGEKGEMKSQPFVGPLTVCKKIFANRPLALLLFAYFLFSDAMLTFANNFPLYLETVHGVSDNVKSILAASILILTAFGALVFGKIADRRGELKTLIRILYIWCFLFLAMILIGNFKYLVPVFFVAGLFFGPIWAISRSLVGKYSSEEFLGSSYSYYVVAERFATFIGPLVWSIAFLIFGEGIAGYQAGLSALLFLIVVSIFVLQKVKEPLH